MDLTTPTVTGPLPGEAYLGPLAFRVSLAQRGYREDEYFISGTATAYTSDNPQRSDGRLTVRPDTAAPYTTRIIVRRPLASGKFNGTVVVEWLNVTSGTDAAPDFAFLHRALIRDGYAWVGVSAQRAGLEGVPGPFAMVKPVKTAQPARYESIVHPGDPYSFDIFSQAASIIRGSPDGPALFGGSPVSGLLAVGESQSAYFLTTYANAIDPIAKVHDGFLIHARGGFAASLAGIDLAQTHLDPFQNAVRVRQDVRVPVMIVQSETDLIILGSVASRQPDSGRIRLWEIAGASHADTYQVSGAYEDAEEVDPARLAAAVAPTTAMLGMQLAIAMNSGPQQHYVLNAALHHLNRWALGGKEPPVAPRLELAHATATAFAADELGIARGGIRSPWVDVPTAVLSGLGQTGAGFAPLFGTTRPFDPERLAELYPDGRDEYLTKFALATDATIKSGFILEADRQEINALAAVSWPVD